MEISVEELLQGYLIPWGTRALLALIVLVVGHWLARLLTRALRSVMARAGLDSTLIRLLSNVAYAGLSVVVALAALEQLGVNTTSALVIVAAAGLAIGLALRDSLANLAAGVMLIISHPFRTGDFIEAGGSSGIVEEVRLSHTLLRTGDNRELTVPNARIYGGTIVNCSARDTRRIDLVFGIGYRDDIAKARQVIEKTIQYDDRILQEPEPLVMLLELADSTVNIAVRPWVKSYDYWAVRADLLENIKQAFDGEGISIPFPRREVHVYTEQFV